MSLVGQVWEYIEDGRLYLVLETEQAAVDAGRTRMLDLQNGSWVFVATTAFGSLASLGKRWRRFA